MLGHDITPDAFVAALKAQLQALPEDVGNWQSHSTRTHWLKGNAIRNGPKARLDDNVLARVMTGLGYVRYQWKRPGQSRVYFHERMKLDLVAVECPENIDDDCWKGRYRTTLALELENDLQEFELTMRGLLDVRADLYCGVFFTSEFPNPEVGRSHHKHSPKPLRTRLSEWISPWHRGQDWAMRPVGDEKLLAVFLSSTEPRLLGARLYEPEGPKEGHPISGSSS